MVGYKGKIDRAAGKGAGEFLLFSKDQRAVEVRMLAAEFL